MLKAELAPAPAPEVVEFAPRAEATLLGFLPQFLTDRTPPLQVRPARRANPPCYPRAQMQRNRAFPTYRPSSRQSHLSALESLRCRVRAFRSCF